ncbi:MAG: glutathione S-transferase family protein [bacterium]
MSNRILHATNTSPFGRQVRIVLAEKALDYGQDQTLALERDAKTFGRVNPALRVPVLEDDGKTIFDTRIIIEYLLAAYPEAGGSDPHGSEDPPLAPTMTRPGEHLDDAMVLAALIGLLDTAVNLFALGRNGVTEEQAPYLGRHKERITASLDWLEERAGPEGFQPGLFSVADLAWICAADYGDMRGLFQVGGRSGLQAIRERYAGRPSVADTRPE